MMSGRKEPTVLAAVLVSFLSPSLAAAEAGITEGDGPLDYEQRRLRHEHRAALAEKRGDLGLAARHYGEACSNGVFVTFDLRFSSPGCRRAAELAARAGALDVEVKLLAMRAALTGWTLDFGKARLLAEEAIRRAGGRLREDEPMGYGLRWAWFILASLSTETGEYEQARAHLARVYEAARRADDWRIRGLAEQLLCRVRGLLGDLPGAYERCTAALETFRSAGDRILEGHVYWQLGGVLDRMGRPASALEAFRKGLPLARLPGGRLLETTLRHNVVAELLILRRVGEAERLLGELLNDLDAGRVPASYRVPFALLQGETAAARGDDRAAADHYAVGARSTMHFMSIRALLGRAGALRRLRDWTSARAAYQEAIRRIEAERAGSPEDQRATFLATHARVYQELVGLLWESSGAAAAEEALRVAEAGRARGLLDALRASGLAGTAVPLAPSDVRSLLRPDELLIVYVSTEARLYALSVSREAVRFTELPGAGTAEEMRERVAFFRQLVQEARGAEVLDAAGRALFRVLLEPLLQRLPHRARTLIVSPDGPLHGLPFDALRTSRGFLAQRFDVLLTPSASLLAWRSRPAPARRGTLAVADPPDTESLGPLRHARAEVAELEDRLAGGVIKLVGAEATEAAVKRAGLEGFGLLHFATHGLVDEVRPLRSSLVLGPGEGEDGHLRASEIYGTRLSADLVVLSACRTALGQVVPGEGPMSLARAFLHSGAGAVVSTLWDVGDQGSTELVRAFAGHLARRPVVGALAEARRDLIRRGAPPRLWAAFVATGSPETTVPTSPGADEARQALWPLGIVAGGGMALLLALVLGLRRVPPARRVAGVALAGVAMSGLGAWLLLWPPGRPPGPDPGPLLASRGQVRGSALPDIPSWEPAPLAFAWSAVGGADAYRVRLYGAGGRVAWASPWQPGVEARAPERLQAVWWKVEASRLGQTIAVSRLHPLGGSGSP